MLISEESAERLWVVLRLRDNQTDIKDLHVKGGKLELHPRSGHPIARLLATVKDTMIGAATEEHFVGAIEGIYEGDWSHLDDGQYVELRKGVRRRFAGLTSAAVKDEPRKPK